MKIQAQLLGADKARRAIEVVPGKVRSNVGEAVRNEGINLAAYVKSRKLSDQVLHVRTGRLRRSITPRYKQEGETYQSIVGTNVKYARIHEYGFKGTVNVREHVVKTFTRFQSVAFGRPMKNPRMVTVKAHTVRAHEMHMNMPERSFLRTSGQENMPRITSNIRKAMAEALK